MQVTAPPTYQVGWKFWIYVHHLNLASFGGGPANLRATRKIMGAGPHTYTTLLFQKSAL